MNNSRRGPKTSRYIICTCGSSGISKDWIPLAIPQGPIRTPHPGTIHWDIAKTGKLYTSPRFHRRVMRKHVSNSLTSDKDDRGTEGKTKYCTAGLMSIRGEISFHEDALSHPATHPCCWCTNISKNELHGKIPTPEIKYRLYSCEFGKSHRELHRSASTVTPIPRCRRRTYKLTLWVYQVWVHFCDLRERCKNTKTFHGDSQWYIHSFRYSMKKKYLHRKKAALHFKFMPVFRTTLDGYSMEERKRQQLPSSRSGLRWERILKLRRTDGMNLVTDHAVALASHKRWRKVVFLGVWTQHVDMGHRKEKYNHIHKLRQEKKSTQLLRSASEIVWSLQFLTFRILQTWGYLLRLLLRSGNKFFSCLDGKTCLSAF